MIFKPGDKINYNFNPEGNPKGVVVSVRFPTKKEIRNQVYYSPTNQICKIKCGMFDFEVPSGHIRIRTVNKIDQVYVSREFRKMNTRKLLAHYRYLRHSYPDSYYYGSSTKWNGNFDDFFNDIGVEDYFTAQQKAKMIAQKHDRDLIEMKYELSQRENIEFGKGAKKLRQIKAQRKSRTRKSKNR